MIEADVVDFMSRNLEMHAKIEKESDRYFAISLVASLLYIMKYFGVELKINLFGVELLSFQNPLFMLAVCSLTFLTLAAIRAADAAFVERIIDGLCVKRWPNYSEFARRSIYGSNSIHHNVMDIPISSLSAIYDRSLLSISRFGVSIVIVLFAVLPIAVGGTYLAVETKYDNITSIVQSVIVAALLLSSFVEGLLAIRFLSHDREMKK